MYNYEEELNKAKKLYHVVVNQADFQGVSLRQEDGRDIYLLGLENIRGFEIRTAKEISAMSEEERNII